MKKFYAVFTKFDSTHRCEEVLESIWSNRDMAIKAAKKLANGFDDYVWMQPMSIDSEDLYSAEMDTEKGDHVLIKPEKKEDD